MNIQEVWEQERDNRSLNLNREARSKSCSGAKLRPRESLEYVEDQYGGQIRKTTGID